MPIQASGAERLVLHPAPDVIETAVRGHDDVEGVRHLAGVIEVRVQPGAVTLVQIAGDGPSSSDSAAPGASAHASLLRGTTVARESSSRIRPQLEENSMTLARYR